MAQRSWTMRMPSVSLPAKVEISSLSKMSFTTISVDDRDNATAR